MNNGKLFAILSLVGLLTYLTTAIFDQGPSVQRRGIASSFEPDCMSAAKPFADQYTVKRTLGVEWEVEAVRVSLVDPETGLAESVSGFLVARLRELFALYGKDAEGNYVKGLIPERIAKSESFQAYRARMPGFFEEREGQVYISDFSKVYGVELQPLITTVFQVRGQYADDIVLRKDPAKWADKKNRFDEMMPLNVAEEWKFGKFGSLEFPMSGAVTKKSELKGYITNLWLRLGIFEPGDPKIEKAAEFAAGHVHWVPDLSSIPVGAEKKKIYAAIKGYWGDANDVTEIAFTSQFKDNVGADGVLKFTLDDATFANDALKSGFLNYSIGILTRETYGRLSATPKGIKVKDHTNGLQPEVDPNFPTVFKRLNLGLRGIYGKIAAVGKAISKVGIEARSMETMDEGLSLLPPKIPGTDTVDFRFFSSPYYRKIYRRFLGPLSSHQYLHAQELATWKPRYLLFLRIN